MIAPLRKCKRCLFNMRKMKGVQLSRPRPRRVLFSAIIRCRDYCASSLSKIFVGLFADL